MPPPITRQRTGRSPIVTIPHIRADAAVTVRIRNLCALARDRNALFLIAHPAYGIGQKFHVVSGNHGIYLLAEQVCAGQINKLGLSVIHGLGNCNAHIERSLCVAVLFFQSAVLHWSLHKQNQRW